MNTTKLYLQQENLVRCKKPLAGFKILTARGVLEYLAVIFRIFLKVLLRVPSTSNSGSP